LSTYLVLHSIVAVVRIPPIFAVATAVLLPFALPPQITFFPDFPWFLFLFNLAIC